MALLYAEKSGFNPATQCTNDVYFSVGEYYDNLSCIGNNPGGGLP